jgi:hypothetical protein
MKKLKWFLMTEMNIRVRKSLTMEKALLLIGLIIVPYFYSCEANEPEVYNYRRQLTVESNLSSLRIDNKYLDTTTIYPFILFDIIDAGGNGVFTIYPVNDTGFIKFMLYGGKSFDRNPSLSFRDSLSIYTPIDTTIVDIVEFKLIKY